MDAYGATARRVTCLLPNMKSIMKQLRCRDKLKDSLTYAVVKSACFRQHEGETAGFIDGLKKVFDVLITQ